MGTKIKTVSVPAQRDCLTVSETLKYNSNYQNKWLGCFLFPALSAPLSKWNRSIHRHSLFPFPLLINCIIKMILSKHKFPRDPSKWHTIIKITVNKSHIFRWPWCPIWRQPPPQKTRSCRSPLEFPSQLVSIFTQQLTSQEEAVTCKYWSLTDTQGRPWGGRKTVTSDYSIKINLGQKRVSREGLGALTHLDATQQSLHRPVSRECPLYDKQHVGDHVGKAGTA